MRHLACLRLFRLDVGRRLRLVILLRFWGARGLPKLASAVSWSINPSVATPPSSSLCRMWPPALLSARGAGTARPSSLTGLLPPPPWRVTAGSPRSAASALRVNPATTLPGAPFVITRSSGPSTIIVGTQDLIIALMQSPLDRGLFLYGPAALDDTHDFRYSGRVS